MGNSSTKPEASGKAVEYFNADADSSTRTRVHPKDGGDAPAPKAAVAAPKKEDAEKKKKKTKDKKKGTQFAGRHTRACCVCIAMESLLCTCHACSFVLKKGGAEQTAVACVAGCRHAVRCGQGPAPAAALFAQ